MSSILAGSSRLPTQKQLSAPRIPSNKPSIHESIKAKAIYPHELLTSAKPTSDKPCEQFGLDPSKLEIEHLLKYRGYRRLYNIVANDQTNNNVFRPNLIKELYFLLQITPFIHESLIEGFLDKIEEWYNANDHKKIKLASHLDGFVTNVLHKSKSNEGQSMRTSQRPKSGIQWDTALHPFLRPYTAKIRSNNVASVFNKSRPESSKFGGMVSTNANTNEQGQNFSEDEENGADLDVIYLREQEEQKRSQIEQQWQRSEDFKKKYRTLHPQEEPTYQKLMSLISNVKITNQNSLYLQNINKPQDKNPSVDPFFRQNNYPAALGKRNIKSAVLGRPKEIELQNAKSIAEEEIKQHREANLEEGELGQEEQLDFGQGNQSQENINEEENEQEDEEALNLNPKKTKFGSDKRSKQGQNLYNNRKGNHMYTHINGAKVVRPYTAKQTHIIAKLDRYSALEQNKHIIQVDEDQECTDKYHQYMKNKTQLRRELSRKSESRRYMQNFKDTVTVLPSRINSARKTIAAHVDELAAVDQIQADTEKQNKKVHDFSNMGNQSKSQPGLLSYPTYNVRSYFQAATSKKVAQSSRLITNAALGKESGDTPAQRMTHNQRIFFQSKFDPLSQQNVTQYNEDILNQIDKIKEKFGGKTSASTQSLLKALYVDEPVSFECGFVIPDKKYLMVQKQDPKKKKRKLKKSKIPNNSQPKLRR